MNKEAQTDLCTITFTASGNADWFSNVVIPLQKDISTALPRHPGEIPPPLRQALTSGEPQITNSWSTVLTVGVAVSVPVGKLLSKVIEEGYAIILKPRIQKMWEGLEKRLTGGNQKSKKAFLFSFWYEEFNVLVTVTVLGNTMDDIVNQMDTVFQVQLNALTRITTIGVSAPVHHYLLLNGKVNAEPELFERQEDVIRQLVTDSLS
jgi:hypothetical protein